MPESAHAVSGPKPASALVPVEGAIDLRKPVSAALTRRRRWLSKNGLVAVEQQMGGRMELLWVLRMPTDLTLEEKRLVNLLADTRHAQKNLNRLCDLSDLSVGAFFAFLNKAKGAQAVLAAMDKVWEPLPKVAEDVMARSVAHEVPCEYCGGAGTVSDPRNAKRTRACRRCSGRGKVEVLPPLDRQKVALTLGGLYKEHRGTVQQGVFNVTVGDVPRTTSGFRTATDRLLFPQREAPVETVEAEAVTVEGNGEEG